jgi:cell division protein FtsB
MRHRTASASHGTVHRRRALTPQTLLAGVVAVVCLWLLISLIQELSLSHSLSQQAADVGAQNSALSTANDGYQRDIAAITSGAAAEEEARQDGYARSDEKLYIITTPPPPAPALAGARSKAPHPDRGPLDGIWHFLTGR